MQRRRSSGGTLIRPVMEISYVENGKWTLAMPSSLRSGKSAKYALKN